MTRNAPPAEATDPAFQAIATIERSLADYQRNRIDPEGLRRAAVALPLLPGEDGLAVLLTRRTHLVEHHKGEICFPGGRVDPEDDNSMAAALREAWEEVGIHPEHARVLGKLDDFVSISGYRVRPYVIFVQDPDYTFTPQPREVEQILIVPVAHLLEPDQHQVLQPLSPAMAPRHRFLWQGHVIWGLTAAMLDQLLRLGFGNGDSH